MHSVVVLYLLIRIAAGGARQDEDVKDSLPWPSKLPVGFYAPHDSESDEETSDDHKSRYPSRGASSYQVYKVRPHHYDYTKGYSEDFEPHHHHAPYGYKPSDIIQMVGAIKHLELEHKPAGLLSKLSDHPHALLVALPLGILLASALPALLKGALAHLMGMPPTVTTVASGGRDGRSSPSLIASVLQRIEDFDETYWHGPPCLQRSFCEARGEGFESLVPKVVGVFGDSWLVRLGVTEVVKALGSVDCQSIHCSDKKGNS